jgi:hypothetical protein
VSAVIKKVIIQERKPKGILIDSDVLCGILSVSQNKKKRVMKVFFFNIAF